MYVHDLITAFVGCDAVCMMIDAFSQHVQPAKLMQLPEGVPEELPVACAGRLALMNVRSQTVTFGGAVMSASRFEMVCGKGDAKKWKSSLWAATPEGIPEQVTAGFLLHFALVAFAVGPWCPALDIIP